MSALPGATPVRRPVTGSIVATDGLLLCHVPPVAGSKHVVTETAHKVSGHTIGPGDGFTVIAVVTEQPVGNA